MFPFLSALHLPLYGSSKSPNWYTIGFFYVFSDWSKIYHFVLEIQNTERRALVLVSKVLQSLGNNVAFGEKEDYMFLLNDHLVPHRVLINAFIDDLLSASCHISTPLKKSPAYYKSAELLQQKLLLLQNAILAQMKESVSEL